MIKVLIIDDELFVWFVIREYFKNNDFVQIIGEVGDGFEGVKFIQELKLDLLFFDVQMLKLNGFEMLEIFLEIFRVIFIMVFDEYVFKVFEVYVFDYLLKFFIWEWLEVVFIYVEKQLFKFDVLKEVMYV